MKHIGMYNAYLNTKGGGEKVFLATAERLSKNHRVTLLTHERTDLKELGKYFNLDLSKLQIKLVSKNTPFYNIVSHLPVPGSFKDLLRDFRLYRSFKKQNYDLFINNTFHSNLPNPGKKGIYMCMFPQKLEREETRNPLKIIYRLLILSLGRRMMLYKFNKEGVYTYDIITANSNYTKEYINKLWGKDSIVLYPVCDSMYKSGIKKEKIILNVGRFFDESDKVAHHKKQGFLLESFIKSSLAEKGWELHFVGSVANTRKAHAYVAKLRKTANGLPVYFHLDAPFIEVKKLYNKASIYWHATGYGKDVEEHPEKQEHFGISTVEAMSAGCIPVVINRAGQRESVADGQNGFLWDTGEELINKTKLFIDLDSQSKQSLINSARGKATKFNKTAFGKNIDRIFSELL